MLACLLAGFFQRLSAADEMLKNCSNNQRLLKEFDTKLHESGLGELAAKSTEVSTVRGGSVSSRRDRVRVGT